MYARLVASVCLLNVGAVAASSERAYEGSNQIGVYLRHHIGVPSIAVDAMRQETNALMEESGYHVQWLDSPREVTAAFLVIVDLEVSGAGGKHLASAVVEDGRILPFIHVNCAAVRQFLAPLLGSKPKALFLYGRALGRLLTHELYHVVAQTADHTSIGLTQGAVSAHELISEQFAFGKDALEKLRQPLPVIHTGFESGLGQ